MQLERISFVRIGAIALIAICMTATAFIAYRSTWAIRKESPTAASKTALFHVSDFSSRYWFQYYEKNLAPAWNNQLFSPDVCDPFHGDTYRVVRTTTSRAILAQVSYAGGVGSVLSNSRHIEGRERGLKWEPFAGSPATLEQLATVRNVADVLASTNLTLSSRVYTERDFAAQDTAPMGIDDAELFGPGNIFIEVCLEGNYSWYQRTQPSNNNPYDKAVIDFANLLLTIARLPTYPSQI